MTKDFGISNDMRKTNNKDLFLIKVREALMCGKHFILFILFCIITVSYYSDTAEYNEKFVLSSGMHASSGL
jgi:hypothetical protein